MTDNDALVDNLKAHYGAAARKAAAGAAVIDDRCGTAIDACWPGGQGLDQDVRRRAVRRD